MSHPGRVMISVVAGVLATFGLLVAVWAGSEATPAAPAAPQPDTRAEVMALARRWAEAMAAVLRGPLDEADAKRLQQEVQDAATALEARQADFSGDLAVDAHLLMFSILMPPEAAPSEDQKAAYRTLYREAEAKVLALGVAPYLLGTQCLPEGLPDEARAKLPQIQAELAQGVMGLLTPVQMSCLSCTTRTDSGHARNR